MRWPGRPTGGFCSLLLGLLVAGCGGPELATTSVAPGGVERAVNGVLDDWHAAAAASDEARYFGHLTADAIFLGTDATERWTVEELRAYARPRFASGRGWVFRPIRRAVIVAAGGALAYFDEDLEGAAMGPARGSGVLRRGADGRWRIAHYVLSLTIPNERFRSVRCALTDGAAEGCDEPAASGAAPRPEVEALRQRLLAARTPSQLFALAHPNRGLDVDLAHSIGHFARTACDVEELTAVEEELSGYAEDFGVESLAIADLFDLSQLRCDATLTRCVTCRADLSDCEGATLFELSTDGQRHLYGIVTRFTAGLGYAEPRPRTVDDLAEVEVGQATEVGVKCALRRQLAAGGLSELRVERHVHENDAGRVSILRGPAAAAEARRLAETLGVMAYCDPRVCTTESSEGVTAIYYRRAPDGTFTVPVVTHAEEVECDGCFAIPLAERDGE